MAARSSARPLSREVRNNGSSLVLNLKPTIEKDQLMLKWKEFRGSKTAFLKSIKLSKSAILLLKTFLTKEEFIDDLSFVQAIQHLSFNIKSLRPIDEVISTVGGISMDEINEDFGIKKMENLFCIGEMLDWDAPTGGYLLQACFASGHKVAKHIIGKE